MGTRSRMSLRKDYHTQDSTKVAEKTGGAYLVSPHLRVIFGSEPSGGTSVIDSPPRWPALPPRGRQYEFHPEVRRDLTCEPTGVKGWQATGLAIPMLKYVSIQR